MSAINRNFRVYHKLEPPYSVMLENRGQDDTLMFESNAVTVLCKTKLGFDLSFRLYKLFTIDPHPYYYNKLDQTTIL